MCSPTRHNIYTGQSPFKTGAYPNHTFAKEGTKSIVHYLKPLGYRIALSGKRHISPQSVFPFEYIGKGSNPDYKAVEGFIKECTEAKTPFCLFLTSNEPHSPWTKGDASQYPIDKISLPKKFVDTPATRTILSKYFAEITYFDNQVGDAMDLVDKYELTDNTMFIATTEQGAGMPFAKWTCYDAGLQTGLIVRWPGKVAANSENNTMIEYSDVVPTFVEAAGGKVAPAVDGKSLIPLLKGKQVDHKEYVFSQMTTKGIINGSPHYGIRAIRSKNFKYIINFTPEIKFSNALTMGNKSKWGDNDMILSWKEKAKNDPDAADKVKRFEWRPAEELYVLNKDKDEWINVANNPEYAEAKKKLKTELEKHMLKVGDRGQEAELEAHLHQGKNRKKKKKK
jgi:uncharacterized sulfatase